MKAGKYPPSAAIAALLFVLFVAAAAVVNGQDENNRQTVIIHTLGNGNIHHREQGGGPRPTSGRRHARRHTGGGGATEVVGPVVQQAEVPDYFDLGTKSYKAQQYDQALTYFQKELSVDPLNADSYISLGDTHVALKRFDEAVRDYGAAVHRLGPNEDEQKANIYFKMGLIYAEQNNTPGAINAYQNAVSFKKDFPEAYNNMAEANMKLGNWREAISNYQALLALDDAKPDADVYYNLGLAHERSGHNQEAIDNYTKSLGLKESIETRLRLCQVDFQMKNWRGVVDNCGPAASANGKGDIYFFLGDAYSELEMYPQAADSYRQAANLNPKDFQALTNLGITYANMGRNAEAIDAFKEALKLDTDTVNTHFRLGQIYSNAGMWSEVISEMSYVIAAQPNSAKAYILSGRASNRLERPQDAIQSLKRALELDPNNDEANYYLGTVYVKLRDRSASLAQYERLRTLGSPRAERLLNDIRQNFPAQ